MCWGRNTHDQIGDGTTTNRTTATALLGISDGVSLSAGDLHTCVVRAGGAVACSGNAEGGQLGNGSPISMMFLPVLWP